MSKGKSIVLKSYFAKVRVIYTSRTKVIEYLILNELVY